MKECNTVGTLPKIQNKIAILASGSGSNAQAIMEYASKHGFLESINAIVTDNPQAKVIERAKAYNINCYIFPIERDKHESFAAAKLSQEHQIIEFCQNNTINWIVLAGYMRILSPNFLEFFYNSKYGINQVINIHPSLLPNFPGKDGYGDAFKANIEKSGISIHYVDQGVDTGPIIAQESFVRLPEDTLESFKLRGLALEHLIYPTIVEKIVKNKLLDEVRK